MSGTDQLKHAGHDVPRAGAARRERAHAHRRGAHLRSAPPRRNAGHRRDARPHARSGSGSCPGSPAALRSPTPGSLADLGAADGSTSTPTCTTPRCRRRAASPSQYWLGVLVAPPGPPPAAVGDDAPRRAGGRALGAGDQDAPLPRRRRRIARHRASAARRFAGAAEPPHPTRRRRATARHGWRWLTRPLVSGLRRPARRSGRRRAGTRANPSIARGRPSSSSCATR